MSFDQPLRVPNFGRWFEQFKMKAYVHWKTDSCFTDYNYISMTIIVATQFKICKNSNLPQVFHKKKLHLIVGTIVLGGGFNPLEKY